MESIGAALVVLIVSESTHGDHLFYTICSKTFINLYVLVV